MAEKSFSVIAEFADGTTKVVPVHSESSGQAFRQVREMPGVRRVGRVAEITPGTAHDLAQGRSQPAQQPAAEVRRAQSAAGNWKDHVISGPRTVVFAPPAGGEQPFKNLYIPPERLKPQPPPQPAKAKVAIAVLAPKPAPSPVAVDATPIPMPAAATAVEYRITKSRRRDGLPYLLQRGQWQQLAGKRAFEVQWEKGFDERDKAEQHLEWVKQTERELASLHQSA
jgi:hypothetical protein